MISRLAERRSEEGFSLIELVIVLTIMGIIFAIALPIYLTYQNQARANAVESDTRSVVANVSRYLDANPGAALSDLQNTTNVPVQISGSSSESITITQDTSNSCTANGDAAFFYIVTGTDTTIGPAASNYYSYFSCSGRYLTAGAFKSN